MLEFYQNKNFCLLGDFNARTANDSNLVPYDENLEQFLHSDNPNDINRISSGDLGFPTKRHNSDMQLNNYRKRLLDLCKPFNLCIANGRLGNDKFLGNKTCKGSSVIDYAILPPLLFTCVHDFEILPFDPMVSDAHSGIYLCLSCTNMASGQIDLDYDTVITKASWKSENSEMFWQHLNANDI